MVKEHGIIARCIAWIVAFIAFIIAFIGTVIVHIGVRLAVLVLIAMAVITVLRYINFI